MKRKLYYFIPFLIFAIVFASCEDDNDLIDETLLLGTWRSGTLHEKYLSNGMGSTWDTADDVQEDEAQEFRWSLSGSELTQLHIMVMGPEIPKIYTVTELTPTRLSYRDSFGRVTSFNKVN